jgi:hypothetical protein
MLRWLRGISWEDHLKKLEEEGKAGREFYQVSRAITFEDLRTSCLVHLLEVGDNQLLCLCGQYYYEFEPIEDDPDMNQPRKFPTQSFSMLRRKSNREILKIFPGADVLEPTVCGGVVQPQKLYNLGIRLEDGELAMSVSFETVEETCRSLGSYASSN